MSIHFVSGDLFLSQSEVIGHGVNAKGVMGAGIALEFKRRYPDMFREYRNVCRSESLKPGDYMLWDNIERSGTTTILNLVTQESTLGAKLEYIRAALLAFVLDSPRIGLKTLAIPAIGAGHGGLSWDVVKPCIKGILGPAPFKTFCYETYIKDLKADEAALGRD
jgi:O-acetyl-ADP-ribose deacetylase (regulator of RNase III)